ncbi:MAG: hypothetical protein GF383_07385, partial [Candidatus Lokiarchaeota archaeon]|nr:hypothetical protein [Candidatus Lokiarchaeota archaeon]MBD3340012.1 hypothetical protein [Candidatus Lokiarchaeota archaeon]
MKYAKTIYQPIIESLKNRIALLEPYLEPYYNNVDRVNSIISKQQWTETVYLEDDLSLKIFKKDPHCKLINGEQRTFPTKFLNFRHLCNKKQKFILKTVARCFF